MPSSDVFPLSLDRKTRKIIDQIQRGYRSETIRRWIQKGAEEENYDVFGSTRKSRKLTGDKAIINQFRKIE